MYYMIPSVGKRNKTNNQTCLNPNDSPTFIQTKEKQ